MSDSTIPRLEEIRQLKKEIRGSEEHLIVGIDVAKKKHSPLVVTIGIFPV